MATNSNGRQNGHVSHSPHRFDELSDLSLRIPSPLAPRNVDPVADGSGRRFVLLAALVIAMLWGVLFVTFRQWRSRYFERAAYGAKHVAPAIDGMAAIDPPGVARDDWEDAIRRTHALIVTVTDSNLLSIGQMNDLRAELNQTVERSLKRPETALDELAHVWNTLAARAAFLFRDTRSTDGRRHIRPAILPAPSKQP
jgi:hypothetical protein